MSEIRSLSDRHRRSILVTLLVGFSLHSLWRFWNVYQALHSGVIGFNHPYVEFLYGFGSLGLAVTCLAIILSNRKLSARG